MASFKVHISLRANCRTCKHPCWGWTNMLPFDWGCWAPCWRRTNILPCLQGQQVNLLGMNKHFARFTGAAGPRAGDERTLCPFTEAAGFIVLVMSKHFGIFSEATGPRAGDAPSDRPHRWGCRPPCWCWANSASPALTAGAASLRAGDELTAIPRLQLGLRAPLLGMS